jgi:uncharacterized protein YchJ
LKKASCLRLHSPNGRANAFKRKALRCQANHLRPAAEKLLRAQMNAFTIQNGDWAIKNWSGDVNSFAPIRPGV